MSWIFLTHHHDGSTKEHEASTFKEAFQLRTSLHPKEGVMAVITGETLVSSSPIRCSKCQSFVWPNGPHGPECLCPPPQRVGLPDELCQTCGQPDPTTCSCPDKKICPVCGEPSYKGSCSDEQTRLYRGIVDL